MCRLFGRSLAGIAVLAALAAPSHGQTIDWQGYTWNVNQGDKIGQGLVRGDASTVSIDAEGYLHLKLSNLEGKWAGAELATVKNLGFGHFYWVFSGPLTAMEPQDVLAGFTYGPQNHIGIDGQNEIDVEFSKWNASTNANNCDFDIYPPPGAKKGANVEYDWNYTGSDVATVRIDWTASQVTETVWDGVVPENAPTNTAAKTWTYDGTKATIPQVPCPFMFNFWVFKALPTVPVDAIVRTFKYIPDVPSAKLTIRH